MQQMVFQETRDVLFEIYAPWCGHCKAMEPAYNKVAALGEQEKLTDLVVLAKMDGTANESAVESIQVEGFPTIFFVKAGQKEPIEYDGGRKAEEIWTWIKENSSFSEEIEKRLGSKSD